MSPCFQIGHGATFVINLTVHLTLPEIYSVFWQLVSSLFGQAPSGCATCHVELLSQVYYASPLDCHYSCPVYLHFQIATIFLRVDHQLVYSQWYYFRYFLCCQHDKLCFRFCEAEWVLIHLFPHSSHDLVWHILSRLQLQSE